MNPNPQFDHEKLDVYQIELAFVGWVTPLLEEIKTGPAGLFREVCDQLDRASLSALLNTAEGNGKRQSKLRARFFDDARGSAVECAACLDALVAKNLTSAQRIIEGKSMLIRVVGMLSKLIERFDSDTLRVREEPDDFEPENRPRPSSSSSSSSELGGGVGGIEGEKRIKYTAEGAKERIEDEDEGRGRGRGPTP